MICVSTGGLLWAQREAPFLWKCTALMFLHMGKGLNGSHDLIAFAFPPWPSGQSSCQISECMDSCQVLGLDMGGKEHGPLPWHPDTSAGVYASRTFGSYFTKVVGKGNMERVGHHNLCLQFHTAI